MSEVVPFRQPKPTDPYLSGEAHCIGCGHDWAAVAPIGVWQLECPSCGTMKGIYRYPVGGDTGSSTFACNCGCEALTAYKLGGLFYLRCMACGTDQTNEVFGE